MTESLPSQLAEAGVAVALGIALDVFVPEDALQTAMIQAGLTVAATDKDGKPIVDERGKPVLAAKYAGLHALRHFYASWCINSRQDGGLELPPKVVQARLGHASIVMTLDTYGHRFPRGDDGAELAVAEKALLA